MTAKSVRNQLPGECESQRKTKRGAQMARQKRAREKEREGEGETERTQNKKENKPQGMRGKRASRVEREWQTKKAESQQPHQRRTPEEGSKRKDRQRGRRLRNTDADNASKHLSIGSFESVHAVSASVLHTARVYQFSSLGKYFAMRDW